MATFKTILAELKSLGTEQTRKTYIRHGAPPERIYGVLIGDLKPVAKKLKGEQALARALFDTGIQDAMYLAGMVADGSLMNEKQLQAWVQGASGLTLISNTTVPCVAVENSQARKLALKWIDSKDASIAASGWCTYAGIVATASDETLDLAEVKALLNRVVREIDSAPNDVRYPMNSFVISVGCYIPALTKQALAAADRISPVEIDMGDTACQVPLARCSIEKVIAAGKHGQKRKTIRC